MDEIKKSNTETAGSNSEASREAKPVLEPGEKVFTIVLLVCGLIAFGLALQLWLRMSQPRISSAGALPLFVTSLWVILTLMALLENRKLTSPLSGLKDKKEQILKGLRYAFPLDVAVMLCFIIGYCTALYFGLSFYIATPLFLYGGMCYLSRKNFVKNLLWTAVVMAFIVLVFRILFGVIFP